MAKRDLQTLLLLGSIFVWLLPASLPASAQKRKVSREGYMEQIEITHTPSKKSGANVSLALTLQLDRLHLDRQHLLLLTPVVHDAAHILKLHPIAIEGSVRHIVLDRKNDSKRTQLYGSTEAQRVVHRNGTAQSIEYNQVLPYEAWFDGASLSVDATVVGCGNCGYETERIPVGDRLFEIPPVAKYRTTIIVPAVEKRKQRSKEYNAYLNFPVGRDVISASFMDNRRELDNIRQAIDEVRNDPNLKIMPPLFLNGYASPEGNERYNMALSERRATALATYIDKNFGIERSKLKVQGFGEDWDGLVELVRASSLDDKEAILHVVATVADLDSRDAPLRAIRQGQAYKQLLATIYPRLRRNTFRIHYEVKPFDVEEAKIVFKKHPEQLSLNEMYLVAETMQRESPEYKELFSTAYRLYPTEPIVIVNTASILLDEHKATEALELLSKIADNSLAWNNLGIAYALLGDYDNSARYFDKAIATGAKEATDNKAEMLEQRSYR